MCLCRASKCKLCIAIRKNSKQTGWEGVTCKLWMAFPRRAALACCCRFLGRGLPSARAGSLPPGPSLGGGACAPCCRPAEAWWRTFPDVTCSHSGPPSSGPYGARCTVLALCKGSAAACGHGQRTRAAPAQKGAAAASPIQPGEPEHIAQLHLLC